MDPQQTDQHDTVDQGRHEARHDTVVLGGHDRPTGGGDAAAPPAGGPRHDTIALPRPPAPYAAQHPPLPAPRPPGEGWQAVNRWREQVVAQAPTAWSQIPPLHSPAPVQIIVRRNNAAVIGATLGSTSLFLALLPLIGVVAWILAPIGLACSVGGLIVGSVRRVGRIGALWGIVTSSVALVICFIWASLLLAL